MMNPDYSEYLIEPFFTIERVVCLCALSAALLFCILCALFHKDNKR